MKLPTPTFRRSLAATAVAIGLIVSVSTFAAGGRAFVGDFETGDLSQWDALITPPLRVGITTAPVRQGRYAALFSIRAGDEAQGQGKQRAEALVSSDSSGAVEGNTAWYGWSTFVPNDFSTTTPVSFTQWKPEGTGDCALPSNVAFQLNSDGQPQVAVSGGGSSDECAVPETKTLGLGDIKKENWNDFMVRVHWSANDKKGSIEVWQNGKRVVSRTSMATLHAGRAAALGLGAERSLAGGNVILYHDAMRRGNSRAKVTPPAIPKNQPPPARPSNPLDSVRFVPAKAPTGNAAAKLASVTSSGKTPAKVATSQGKATPTAKPKTKPKTTKKNAKGTPPPSQRPTPGLALRDSGQPASATSATSAPGADVPPENAPNVKNSYLTKPVLMALLALLLAIGVMAGALAYGRHRIRSSSTDATSGGSDAADEVSAVTPTTPKKRKPKRR